MKLDIVWNEEKYENLINYLKNIRDLKYKDFNRKLTPTKYEMLGIRLPMLKKIAQEISKGDYVSFLGIAKNNYFEEVMLQGLVIASIKDYATLMKYFSLFVNLIDNWAICDSFCSSLKIVKKNKEQFLKIIDNLIISKETFKIRVGLVLLLDYYVEKNYLKLIFTYLNNIESSEYYVNMARAWLICECFINEQALTLKYLEKNNLDKFTINKAISKIRDSYRVNKEMKEFILKYRK